MLFGLSTPQLSKLHLPEILQDRIVSFINTTSEKITNANRFQEIYCKTEMFREKHSLMGPMEVLDSVRSFIDTLEISSEGNIDVEANNNQKNSIPVVIVVGYYLLSKLINYTKSR